jgi:DNA mismatch repair protein MutL
MTNEPPASRRPIRLLPSDLRDQIAAGEVVERPASAVKELVENAIDAGARTIRVEIDGGGLDRIAVIDDGAGMERDDALLAIQRHATSKLIEFEDLYRLDTFGFRGEALPSIAAVSRFRLVSRTAKAVSATEVTVEGGAPPRVSEVGGPQGTAIEVRDLFYNVPARRKFLKSVATEAAQVSDSLVDLALARPTLALTFVRDGRTAKQWLRARDRVSRARDAVGKPGTEDFVHVTGERERLRVEAWLSPPERARTGATGLRLLVNDRAVQDRLLARAIAMAFGSVLDPGRYPVGVVWLDVPPEDVDVNVHPQKAEVRFARGRALYDDVTRTLGAALAECFAGLSRVALPAGTGGTTLVGPEIRALSAAMEAAISPLAQSRMAISPPLSPSRRAQPESVGFDSAIAASLRGASRDGAMATERGSAGDAEETERDPWGLAPPPRDAFSTSARASSSSAIPVAAKVDESAFGTSRGAASDPPSSARASVERTLDGTLHNAAFPSSAAEGPMQRTLAGVDVAPPARGELRYGALTFLAQVRATYLLCEGETGLYVIDQHAAAERVNYARLRASHAAGGVSRQQLLTPEIVDVTSAESAAVDELRERFLSLGVDARAIGDGRVAVHGVPALLPKLAPSTLLRDLLDEVARTGDRAFGDAADLVLATMACHGSVRAGDPLHPDECRALLRALDDTAFAGYCPHGRPIVTILPFVDLEKKVGRR